MNDFEFNLETSLFEQVLPRHYHLLTQLSFLSRVPLIYGDYALLGKLSYLGSGWVIPSSRELQTIATTVNGFKELEQKFAKRFNFI